MDATQPCPCCHGTGTYIESSQRTDDIVYAVLARERRIMTQVEISRETRIPQSSVCRAVKRLRALGKVQHGDWRQGVGIVESSAE